MRSRTAAGMPPGRLWSVAGRQLMSTFGRSFVSATSSRARAPQPTTSTRGAAVAALRRDAGTLGGSALVDQAPRGLGRDTRIAAVGVRPDGHAELLVQRRAADQHDVVVPDLAVLEGLDDDLHVRHRR